MSKIFRCTPPAGGRAPLLGLSLAAARIVSTHCCCSCVMVADWLVSRLILLNESQMTPTKRLSAKKEPTNIHTIEKKAAGE